MRQGSNALAFLERLFSLIDMRSFSSVWFWIVVGLYWSVVSQSVLGASHDLILRAGRGSAQDQHDLHSLIGIHVRRRLLVMRRSGHWIVAFVTTILTLILLLAFAYRLEFAQALIVLLVPVTLVRLLELRLCFRIERESPDDTRLPRLLLQHRFWVQFMGVVAIFVTAVWGMLHVMSRSMLGL